MARGRPIPARTSMTVGLATMAVGHFAFAFLPANWVVLVGGIAFGVYLPLFWLPMNSLLVRETFFFKQKTAYEVGLGIPAEPLFRSLVSSINIIARCPEIRAHDK